MTKEKPVSKFYIQVRKEDFEKIGVHVLKKVKESAAISIKNTNNEDPETVEKECEKEVDKFKKLFEEHKFGKMFEYFYPDGSLDKDTGHWGYIIK